jgi:hypothetical protein
VTSSTVSGTLSIPLPQDVFLLVETQLDLLDEYLYTTKLGTTPAGDGLLIFLFRNISCKHNRYKDQFLHEDLETCVAADSSFLLMADRLEE